MSLAIRRKLFDDNETYFLTLSLIFRMGKLYNSLPLLFKALLQGQNESVFFSGHLNLLSTPEPGLPSRGKNHNN